MRYPSTPAIFLIWLPSDFEEVGTAANEVDNLPLSSLNPSNMLFPVPCHVTHAVNFTSTPNLLTMISVTVASWKDGLTFIVLPQAISNSSRTVYSNICSESYSAVSLLQRCSSALQLRPG